MILFFSNIYGTSATGSGSSVQVEDVNSGENEQPPKVVLTTAAAILPRLKDFHSLLLDPPPVSILILTLRNNAVENSTIVFQLT